MRTMATLLCASALVACASNKSAEPPIENPNDPGTAMASEPVNEEERAAAADYEHEPREPASRERAAGEPASREPASHDAVAADNTGVNERDEAPSALMPTDQGESASDVEITQNIRKAVMDDDSLSFTAKNVKIITQDGKVTLRGPVKSADERSAVGAAAKRFAQGRVDNQLEVAK